MPAINKNQLKSFHKSSKMAPKIHQNCSKIISWKDLGSYLVTSCFLTLRFPLLFPLPGSKIKRTWTKVGPKLAKVGSKFGQVGTKMRHVGVKLAHVGPKLDQLDPTWRLREASWSELEPKLTPSCSKLEASSAKLDASSAMLAPNAVILHALAVERQDLNKVTAKTTRCKSNLPGSVSIVARSSLALTAKRIKLHSFYCILGTDSEIAIRDSDDAKSVLERVSF